MRCAAVQCRSVQRFGFHRSAHAATKVEFHLDVRHRVLVQNDHRCLDAAQLRGIGRCIDSCSLQLRRELGLQQYSVAERTCKLETTRDWPQRIVRAKGRNRCIERMRMCGNLCGSFAIRFASSYVKSLANVLQTELRRSLGRLSRQRHDSQLNRQNWSDSHKVCLSYALPSLQLLVTCRCVGG